MLPVTISVHSTVSHLFRFAFMGLVWSYAISTIVRYLIPNPVYTYISDMYNFLITFLNEPKLIVLHTIKCFQLLLCITNNLDKHQSFVK